MGNQPIGRPALRHPPRVPLLRADEREQVHLGLARQLYFDGELNLEQFEKAVEIILRGGTIHDAGVTTGLPPPIPLPAVGHVYSAPYRIT